MNFKKCIYKQLKWQEQKIKWMQSINFFINQISIVFHKSNQILLD